MFVLFPPPFPPHPPSLHRIPSPLLLLFRKEAGINPERTPDNLGSYYPLESVQSMISLDLANQRQNHPESFAIKPEVVYKYNADADSTFKNSKNAHGLTSVTFHESNAPSTFMTTMVAGGNESDAVKNPGIVKITTALDAGITLNVGIPKFTQPENVPVDKKHVKVVSGFDLKTKVCFDKMGDSAPEAYFSIYFLYLSLFYFIYPLVLKLLR